MTQFFLIGGAVRDRLLNLNPKDLDYTCVASSYEEMRQDILARGGTIFVEKPEFLTIRAKMPKLGDADFVLARKESTYTDGRRPDFVEPGTLLDDQKRRDATINSIAMAEDGTVIDPFNGQEDLKNGLLRCVGNPYDRFSEDSLRLLRFIRFAITRDFQMHVSVQECLRDEELLKKLKNISVERISEELKKCFLHNTIRTLWFLDVYDELRDQIFSCNPTLKLIPTLKP